MKKVSYGAKAMEEVLSWRDHEFYFKNYDDYKRNYENIILKNFYVDKEIIGKHFSYVIQIGDKLYIGQYKLKLDNVGCGSITSDTKVGVIEVRLDKFLMLSIRK